MRSYLQLSLSSPAQLPAKPERVYFVGLSPEAPSRWRSFCLSFVVHLLGFFLAPPITMWVAHVPEASDRGSSMRRERLLGTVRLRVPEQLYIASSGSLIPPYKPASARKRVGAPPGQAAPSAQPAGGRQGRRPGHRQRRFELPPLSRRANVQQSILQPQFAEELPAPRDVRLPEVFFWNLPGPLQQIAKPFVMPGHAIPPTQPRRLDAPPVLEMPNPGQSVLAPGGSPQTQALLRIPAQSQSAMPIQTSESDVPHPGVSSDPIPGDPTSILSLTSNPMPLREFLTIPPGNQIGPTGGGAAEGSTSGTDAGGGAGRAGAGTGTNGLGEGTGPGGTGRSGGGSGGPGGAGESGGSGGASSAGSSLGTTAGAPSSATPLGAIRSAAIAAAARTRIVHPPTGVFDIVVQSGGQDAFPESAGILSGRPIYSAYLQVGARKDWIVQYCIPAEDSQTAEVSESVVRLGSDAPLVAPYPRVTMRPQVHWRAGTYLMVHGIISADGTLQALQVLGANDPHESAAVLAVLELWEFRPAMQQGRPVRVEFLLAIPGE